MSCDPLTSTFAALADPTRRAILARLSTGEGTVTELIKPFRLSQPAITKHLKVLENAGLISRSRHGQTRPAKLETGALKQAAAWIDEYRKFWEGSFDRLDLYLKTLQAEEKKHEHKRK